MILGVNATKSAIVIAETRGTGGRFAISALRLISFEVCSGNDLAQLLRSLTEMFDRHHQIAKPTIALLKCSSGRFGSCLEAIKGEAIIELAAFQLGLPVTKIAPQSLKKALGCPPGQKWQKRATELFNPDGLVKNWSKGAVGAVAVAFKLAAS